MPLTGTLPAGKVAHMTQSGWETTWGLVLGLLVFLALAFFWIVWRKGRPFAPGEVFRASRLSAGNRLLPTQVLITPTSVVHYTPQWFGKYEHSIHMAHVASVGIDTNLVFSNVVIETTGGASPIRCTGHYKSDAVAMKALVERHQTAYYAAQGAGPQRQDPAPAVSAS
jgi:hypothetical protein